MLLSQLQLINLKQVHHCFMSENVPFKQRHLQGMLEIDGSNCCIFHDATKVCTDERECVVHRGCCETCLIEWGYKLQYGVVILIVLCFGNLELHQFIYFTFILCCMCHMLCMYIISLSNVWFRHADGFSQIFMTFVHFDCNNLTLQGLTRSR